jgi:hypothetical protein
VAISLSDEIGGLFFSISVNGSFDHPNGVVVRDKELEDTLEEGVFASFTCQGYSIKLNFGENEFKYAPPDETFESVLSFFPESVFLLK